MNIGYLRGWDKYTHVLYQYNVTVNGKLFVFFYRNSNVVNVTIEGVWYKLNVVARSRATKLK